MPDRWMTYEQAGELFALSSEAIRKRSRRLGWRTQAGNEGRTLILVPDRAELRPPGRQAGHPPGPPAGDQPDGPAAELVAELRRRAEAAEAQAGTAEARARQLAGELASQHERAGRAEGERDVVQAEAAALRAEAARLREAMVAERERANAALARAMEAEARLAAGSPVARALKTWRAILAQRKRP